LVAEVASATSFSGVVRIDLHGETVVAEAYGLAHRGHAIPMTVDTRLAIASGVKGLTAMTVVSLIVDGHLELDTRARAVLGADLPVIGDDVTVGHLLAHRSGIGDYVDEEADLDVTEHVLPVPVHQLVTTEDYLAVLDGHPRKFPAGQRFAYCNSGYVVLALIAERVAATGFHDLVHERVCVPAGMHDTAFLRSDEPETRVALGYLDADGLRTNVLHLPVRGSGDGGIYTTAADVHALWTAFAAGDIVPPEWVARMVEPHPDQPTDEPSEELPYGLGFWLDPPRGSVLLEGYDAGVSFRSVHAAPSGVTWTVISNTTEAAWPVARRLRDALTPPSTG
jgi:CubicO group peptidase (beta-lactamase class C family)